MCARDILIEQVQTMPPQNVVQRYYKNNTMTEIQRFSIDLRFSHAIKVLFFGLKNVTNSSVHSNYTTGIPVIKGVQDDVCVVADVTWDRELEQIQNSRVTAATMGQRENNSTRPMIAPLDYSGSILELATKIKYGNDVDNNVALKLDPHALLPRCCLEIKCCNSKNPMKRASIIYENTPRIGLMTADYYSKVQPYYHAVSIPNDDISPVWCSTGLHMYSYSLDFNSIDPLGSTNFGKLTNVHLEMETENDLSLCGQDHDGMSGHNKLVCNLAHTNNNVNKEEKPAGSVHVSRKWESLPEARNISEVVYVDLAYETHISCVNNNILRVSGDQLDFRYYRKW